MIATAHTSVAATAYDFISLVVGESKTVLFRPIETWNDGGKKKSRVLFRAITYTPCKKLLIKLALDKLLPLAEREHANLFYGVCPRVGGDGKYDQAWAIRSVNSLWSDVDGCTPDEVFSRCDKAALPRPSIVVNSGNGAHLYWLLSERYLIDDVSPPPPVCVDWIDQPDGKPKKKREWIKDAETGEKLRLDQRGNVPSLSPKALRIQDVIAGIAAKIGGDHTQDLSRLLRLPGTLNRKDERNGNPPVPCEIVSIDPTLRYSFSEFERFAQEAPQKIKRDKLGEIPLPKPRRVPPGRRDKLDELITASSLAPIGERSQRDFDLICFAIRNGVAQAELWAMVANVGKFAEAGERYFLRTWAAAESEAREQIYRKVEKKHGFKASVGNGNGHAGSNGHAAERESGEQQPEATIADLANFDLEERGDEGETRKLPRAINTILANWRTATGDWPRRVGEAMFVPAGESVNWIKTPAALFGWASGNRGIIEWTKGTGFTSKEEFHAEFLRTATAHDAIEPLPHFPPVASHYYTTAAPQPGDGQTLYALLTRFAPATQVDLDLILAALATIFWGGDGGCRPAFVVTSDAGRGAGKSTIPKMFGYLAGGFLDFSPKSEIDKIKTRLLSGDGMTKRVALLDNIKTLRFSWGELEGLITAPWISGHRMFFGEGDRPNRLTWFLTLNGASLSTDMAQRCVIIKVAQSVKSGEWEEETKRFILDNRQAIFADVAAFFACDRNLPAKYSRWGAWERDVLSRLPEPEEAQKVILERQAEADTERDDHEQVEDFFAERLAELGYDVDAEKIFIPSEVCCRWLNWAQNGNHSTGDSTRIIKQAATEGVLKRIKAVGRSYGRGFLWVGEDAGGKTAYSTDIKERIAGLVKKRAENRAEEKLAGETRLL